MKVRLGRFKDKSRRWYSTKIKSLYAFLLTKNASLILGCIIDNL